MKATRRSLVLIFERHEAQFGPRHGLADRGGVCGVILAALAGHPIRSDQLGRH
jgi:hypothetical protein